MEKAMTMKCRHLRTWLPVIIIVICFFATPSAGQQTALVKMTVGYTPISASMLPLWVAVEERIFQKYGLEVSPVFFGGSSLINAAMAAGQFPIGMGGGASTALQRLSGGDLILIGAVVRSFTIDVWVKPEIKSLTDLKGKRIAVTRIGTTTHFAGLATLAAAGLERDAVVFAQTGGQGEALAALLSGGVEGAMLAYPHNLIAGKGGFHKLMDLAKTEYGLFPSAGIAVRESWLKDPGNRKIALGFLRSLSEGMAVVKANAAVGTRLLRKYTKIDDDSVLHATYDWINGYFPKTLRVEEKSVTNMLRFLDHPKAKGADSKQFFDNRLVDEITK
jgi:ABC-type nitrate/sulfonate/bicarbonate transport system substrate-binding protein